MADDYEKLKRERDFWRRLFRDRLFEFAEDLGLRHSDWQSHVWLIDGPSDEEIEAVLNTHKIYNPGILDAIQEERASGRDPDHDQCFGYLIPPRSILPQYRNPPREIPQKMEALPPAPMAEFVLKECSRCHRNQPIEDYAEERDTRDGRANICKICHKEDRLDKKALESGVEVAPARMLTGRLTMAVNEAIRHLKANGRISEEWKMTLGQKHQISLRELEEVIDEALSAVPTKNGV